MKFDTGVCLTLLTIFQTTTAAPDPTKVARNTVSKTTASKTTSSIPWGQPGWKAPPAASPSVGGWVGPPRDAQPDASFSGNIVDLIHGQERCYARAMEMRGIWRAYCKWVEYGWFPEVCVTNAPDRHRCCNGHWAHTCEKLKETVFKCQTDFSNHWVGDPCVCYASDKHCGRW